MLTGLPLLPLMGIADSGRRDGFQRQIMLVKSSERKMVSEVDTRRRDMSSEGGAAATKMAKKATLAAAIGNVLEWYDFGVYGFFAVIIGAKFFSAGDSVSGLLSAFLVFGIGFVARPAGGIVIGLIADKHGRRPALMITIMLMAIGTLMIGVAPTYESVGAAATAILVIARLLQGFSTGGEWGASASYIVEWAPSGKRGLYASAQQLTAYLGILLGSSVAGILTTLLPTEHLNEWGWRLPFILGALIGPVGLYIRRSIPETPAFVAAKENSGQATHWIAALRLFCLVAVTHSVTFTFMYYLPTFTQKYAGVTVSESYWSNSIALAVFCLAVPLAGALSDRVGRKPLLFVGNALFLFLSLPLITVTVQYPGFATTVFVQILFSLFFATYAGAAAVTCVELFPTKTRMRWLSPTYNLSGIAFGAFAPYVATWLVTKTGEPSSVVYLVVAAAVLAGLAIIGMRETAHGPLD
jgi:MHS family proline/betaine transporter-like MFS transporter